MTQKLQPKKGRVTPFFISLENDDFIIHNCMVDSGATHNSMPLSVMRTIGLDCTRHYQDSECIFSIDSSVRAYGEIKYFCARISFAPTIHTIFTIIMVDLPSAYNLVLGHEWIYPIGGYLRMMEAT
jgi:hypothetical protein